MFGIVDVFFARSGLLEEACLDNNCRRVLATSENPAGFHA